MIRFLAVLKNDRDNIVPVVIPVSGSEVYSTAMLEKAKGSKIIGDFSDPDVARRAATLGLKGWRLPSTKKAS
jgi:hypothetical protein